MTLDRRSFLKGMGAAGLLTRFGTFASATDSNGSIPKRTLGHTGQQVSMLGLGGYHIGMPSEQEGIRIVRTALDNGMNFLDNCWDYNDGLSEARMGRALRDGYRQKAFLMTKIDGRDAKTAAEQIDQSLRRLQTDHLDVLQFHEVIRMNDPERIFAAGGGMEAALKARQAGKLRFIGFTGHKSPLIHKHMLEVAEQHKFTFDTVLMPLNVMDEHYESFQQIVLPMLQAKNIGVLGMKPIGAGILLAWLLPAATPCQCWSRAESGTQLQTAKRDRKRGPAEQNRRSCEEWTVRAVQNVAKLRRYCSSSGMVGIESKPRAAGADEGLRDSQEIFVPSLVGDQVLPRFAALGAVKEDPGGEIVCKLDEAMFLAGRDKQDVAGSE